MPLLEGAGVAAEAAIRDRERRGYFLKLGNISRLKRNGKCERLFTAVELLEETEVPFG